MKSSPDFIAMRERVLRFIHDHGGAGSDPGKMDPGRTDPGRPTPAEPTPDMEPPHETRRDPHPSRRSGPARDRLVRFGDARPVLARPPPGRDARQRPKTLLISLATIAVALAAWGVATQTGLVKPLFLPRPESVLKAFADAVEGRIDGAPLLEHVVMSLGRVAGAFLLAALVGIPVGLATGLSPTLRAVLDPFIEFYRPLPPLAYLPLVIIWFGIGETSKILLIFLACFAPVALAARAGVAAASADQINAARALGASRLQVVRHVVLPAALPTSWWACASAWASAGPRWSRPRWWRPRPASARWCSTPRTSCAPTS